MIPKIRIGTRDSQLALWQANSVKSALEEFAYDGELKLIKSSGDIDQKSEFKAMSSVGIFTKALDQALLRKEIDIAVHSLKDAPTVPEEGLKLGAVLKRANPYDLLIRKTELNEEAPYVVGTGSIRRKAQWLNKFNGHTVKGIRGNVDTRLRKLEEEEFDAIILANAGLMRLNAVPRESDILDWMIPAPAQGIVGIYCREEDQSVLNALDKINHQKSMNAAIAERALLNELEGGCSAPIGALAILNEEKLTLQACLLSEDGMHRIDGLKKGNASEADKIGRTLAREMLSGGGEEIIAHIRYAR
ncbi:MAG: hydroxymethylbilane synthase [Bacteroidota bacterium]